MVENRLWRRGGAAARRLALGTGVAMAVILVPGQAGVAAAQEPKVVAPPQAAETPRRVLTLREAVATALEENQRLATARHTLEEAQAQAREAWGSIMPRANFSMNYTRNLLLPRFFLPARFLDPAAPEGEVVAVETGSENSWYAQARVDQPIFDGQAFIGVGAAGRFEELQQEVLRGEAQQVATSTRLRYFDVLLAQEQGRLTANSVQRVERVLDETRKLNQAGMVSDYDVLRLEVELANLEPNLRRSRNALESARRALAVEMGVEGLEGVELAGSLLTLELPPLPGEDPGSTTAGNAGDAGDADDAGDAGDADDAGHGRLRVGGLVADGLSSDGLTSEGITSEGLTSEELLEIASRRRSELRQLRLTRDLRATERRAELADYLPKISLFGTWTRQAQHDGGFEFFGGNSFQTRAVGIQVDIPLFSGFQRPARLSQMAAVVDQVDARLEYAREQSENEVMTLADQARESYQRVTAQRRAVAQATRGYEIAHREYRAGLRSQLQVTDAELALRQSEFNYAQSVYDYLTAQAQLDAAIGVVPGVDTGDAVDLEE